MNSIDYNDVSDDELMEVIKALKKEKDWKKFFREVRKQKRIIKRNFGCRVNESWMIMHRTCYNDRLGCTLKIKKYDDLEKIIESVDYIPVMPSMYFNKELNDVLQRLCSVSKHKKIEKTHKNENDSSSTPTDPETINCVDLSKLSQENIDEFVWIMKREKGLKDHVCFKDLRKTKKKIFFEYGVVPKEKWFFCEDSESFEWSISLKRYPDMEIRNEMHFYIVRSFDLNFSRRYNDFIKKMLDKQNKKN